MNHQNEERDSISVTEVLRATRPLHIFCRLLGLEPFAIDSKAQKLRNRCWYKIVSCFWIVIELCAFLQSIYWNYIILISSFKASTFIATLATTVVCIISLTTICTDLLGNPRKYAKILCILRYCDEQLGTKNGRKAATKARYLVWVELVLLVSLAAASVYLFRDGCLLNLCGPFSLQMTRAVSCALRFGHLVTLVRLKLRDVNSCLRGMQLQPWDTYARVDRHKVRLVACRHLARAGAASSLVQLKDVVCGLRQVSQLVMATHQAFIAEALLLVLTGSSFLVFRMTQDGGLVPWGSEKSVTQMLAVAFLAVLLLVLVVPAHCAALEARRSRQLVTWLLMDEQLRACAQGPLRLLAQQLAYQPPAFPLFGTVAVDLGLLFSVLSALSTYTVLLITFK